MNSSWKSKTVNTVKKLIGYHESEAETKKHLKLSVNTPIADDFYTAAPDARSIVIKNNMLRDLFNELDKHNAIQYALVHEDDKYFANVQIDVLLP